MKLTAILFFLAIFTVSAEGYSQGTRVSMKMEDASLKEVFRELKSLSDYTFVYSEGMVADIKIDEINLKDVSVEDALTSCLEGTDLEYYIENNVVVIRKKAPVYEQPIEQEKKEIKGKVTDDQGVPLPGVSVVIKGTSVGVATDIDGNYSLEMEGANAVLIFSFVGMLPQEAIYNGQSIQNITLTTDTEQMAEVVVTGYQTISKERATGSFSILNEEIIERKITTDFTSRLEGMVPGLQVDRNGSMTIRGTSTLNASTEPLVVVDGFPMESSNLNINPNDIKSVNVLKDAAATSIWGVRASNGVIVITTKKGSNNNKTNVNFSYNMTFNGKPNMDDYRYANAAEQIDAELELIQKGWMMEPNIAFPSAQSQVADIVFGSPNYNFMHWMMNDHPYDYLSEEEIGQINELKKQEGLEEYKKYFLRNAIKNQYNVSINGGNEKINYYISGIFDRNKENIVRTGMNRTVLNSRLEVNLIDWLKLRSIINYSNTKETNGQFTQELTRVQPLYGYGNYLDADGNYNPFPNQIAQIYKDEYEQKDGYLDWTYNPLQDFRNTSNETESNTYRIQTGLNVNIIEGLNLDILHQYEMYDSNETMLYGEESHTARHAYNTYTSYDMMTGKVLNYFPQGAINSFNNRKKTSNSIRTQLNYSKQIDDHYFKAIGGWEYRSISINSMRDAHVGYNPDFLTTSLVDWNMINQNQVPTWNGSQYNRIFYYKGPLYLENEERYVSFYTNAGWSFANKYDLTVSARIDDSNLFGADKAYRLLPLWSVGAGWDITKEEFFNVAHVNFLKFRLSYGFNGNIDRTTVPQMKVKIFKDVMTQDIVGEIENPGNESLRWEKTQVTNFGVDYGLFKNRLNGSFELYSKISRDLLGHKPVNPVLGYQFVRANVAEVSNKGFEANINYTPIRTNSFEWTTGINIAYNKNKIKKAYTSANKLSDVFTPNYYEEGRPIGALYSYKWAGLNEEGRPLVYDVNGEKTEYISDIPENREHLKYSGSYIAPWNGNFTSTVNYRGFSLSVLLTGQFGHYFRMPRLNYNNSGMMDIYGNIMIKEIADRWMNPGDEETTNVPKIGSGFSDIVEYEYYNQSDLRLKPADFISLREINLTYQLNNKLLEKTPFSTITLSAQARNLGKWVKNDEGIDPEMIMNSYYSIMNDPIMTTYSFGIKASF